MRGKLKLNAFTHEAKNLFSEAVADIYYYKIFTVLLTHNYNALHLYQNAVRKRFMYRDCSTQ